MGGNWVHNLKTCLLQYVSRRNERPKARTSGSAVILAASVRSLAFKNKHKYVQKNGSMTWREYGMV